MEMPDVIYVEHSADEWVNGKTRPLYEGGEQWDGNKTAYHHSRIVEALKAENETHKKAYWDLLESWSDLRVKYSITVDELADIKAKLDKAKWQPIESAPRDGKSILVTDGYDVCDAYFRGGDWWQYQCGDDWYSTSINPTHWMPLPSCPE